MAAERKHRLDLLGFVWQTRALPKSYVRNGNVMHGRQKSSVLLPGNAQIRRTLPQEQLLAENSFKVTDLDSLPDQRIKKANFLTGSSVKTEVTSPVKKDAAPWSNGALVPFPDYDGSKEPKMWKKALSNSVVN